MTTTDAATLAAYRAAEVLAYAAMTGNTELAHSVRRDVDEAIALSRAPADEQTRREVVENDPVSAAALGWLTFPALRSRVKAAPDACLELDEVTALRESPGDGTLRLVVLARIEGRPLQAVLDDARTLGADAFALAARGDARTAQRVWGMLQDQGIVAADKA